MDAYDIYKKLVFGTSFDINTKKKRKKKRNKGQANGDIHMDDESEIRQSRTQLDEDNDFEQNQEYSDEEAMTDEVQSPKQKKKKKDKTMSLMKMTKIRREQIRHLRKIHRIHVEGSDIPDPIENFQQLATDYGVNSAVLSNIEKSGYVEPTPVQMQAIPLLLNERQVLVSAPTGSGKTAAFLIPIIHTLKSPCKGGFRALIVVPTRELAKQIHRDCLRLSEGTNLRPHVIDKVKNVVKKPKLATKYDILISTPNRLIFMLQQDPPLVALGKVEWLIIDESDKLFEAGKQGFREQLAIVYNACDSVQVKRAMFSATFSYDVEQWCKLNLDSVASVFIGEKNAAVTTVKQELVFVGSEYGKLMAFRELIKKGLMPPVLVFVQTKERARDLFKELIYDGIMVDVIHADRPQLQRDNVVRAFRAGKIWVLICTELMGRGIDFKGVNLVINYDFPPSAISYIHRIGRTGRAGNPGQAITYFTEDDLDNLRSIAQVIKNAGCEIPEYVKDLKKKTKKKKKMTTVKVKREKISTVPKYVLEKDAKKKQIIKKSKLHKSKNKGKKLENKGIN